MAPFYGWGSTASRLESLQEGSLLFTTLFPEIPGRHFINLNRWKAESTVEPPGGFEHRTSRLGIQCLNHWAIAPIWQTCSLEYNIVLKQYKIINRKWIIVSTKNTLDYKFLVYNWSYTNHKPWKEVGINWAPNLQVWHQLLLTLKKVTLYPYMSTLWPYLLNKSCGKHCQQLLDTSLLTICPKKMWTWFLGWH